jgi:hypothetical protein
MKKEAPLHNPFIGEPRGGRVTEPPRGGVHRHDQLEQFSAKQEHNQHT